MSKKNKHKKLPIDLMPQISNVVSSNECTGMVPTQPENQDELEADMDLFSSSLPPVWDEEDDEE